MKHAGHGEGRLCKGHGSCNIDNKNNDAFQLMAGMCQASLAILEAEACVPNLLGGEITPARLVLHPCQQRCTPRIPCL